MKVNPIDETKTNLDLRLLVAYNLDRHSFCVSEIGIVNHRKEMPVKKNSKKPEIRRKELVNIASRLFSEKGYEAVSVRDILGEVNGAPGMFYYYFQSKQDIYLAVIEQYLSERIDARCAILLDEKRSFAEKKETFRSLLIEDITGYVRQFQISNNQTITDAAYRLYDFAQMLNRLIHPYAVFILQGIDEGAIRNNLGITPENADAYATYAIYGAWGMIHNGTFVKGGISYDLETIITVVQHLFGTE